MSTPAAKRRRIDAASHALSKPFRSPFKTTSMIEIPVATSALLQRDSSNGTRNTPDNVTQALSRAKFPQSTMTAMHARSMTSPFSSPAATAKFNADPEVAALLRKQHEVEKQLREMRELVDIAEQAGKIEADSERKNPGGEVDGELLELIQKWRSASRQAAEELFTSVRDRVNRMGGPKAWKEMEEKRREFQGGWDAELPPQPDPDDEDADNLEKRDLYAEYGIDPETANEKEARGGNDTIEDIGAEDEFTMAMMLRSLHIPLTTIGYEREHERWSERGEM